MTPTEAKRLKIGDRVKWQSSGELGTVAEIGGAGIRVHWEDGTNAVYLFAAVSSGLLHLIKVKK